MDKASHSSRIRLGTLADQVHPFEIPIWNLKTDFQKPASAMVGVINADSRRASLLVTIVGQGDSLLNPRFRMGWTTDLIFVVWSTLIWDVKVRVVLNY